MRPVDCGHTFDRSDAGDYFECHRCGMKVPGEAVEAARQKTADGKPEPLRDAVLRAARIQLQESK